MQFCNERPQSGGRACGAVNRKILFCAVIAFLSAGACAYAADTGDAPQSGMEYFLAGGRIMWAILLCSVIVVAYSLERLLAFRRGKLIDDAAFDDILSAAGAGDFSSAAGAARDSVTPMGRVLGSVLISAGSPRAELETLVEDAGARELWELQRNTRPLGIVSNVAPLLGLLGTVVGIIRAFGDVATRPEAIGNPQILATGIYEALITTAAGLLVAIPAYLLHHYFRGRAEAAIKEIEEKSLALISAIVRGERVVPATAEGKA